MSALLDSLAGAFDALAQPDAAGLGESRRAARDAMLQAGLPAPRSEAWKYTSLRALERRTFVPAPADAVVDGAALDAALAPIPAPRLVFVDGRFDAARSDLSGLPAGVDVQPLSRVLREGEPRDANFLQRRYAGADQALALANAALAEEGAVVRLGEGVDAGAPLHLVLVAGAALAEVASHLRHFVELRRDARLQLVEHHLALGAHRGLANHIVHLHLAQRAQLQHVRVQAEDAGATLFARSEAVLARESGYARTDFELGAGLSRHELDVRLEGEQASLSSNGVLLADDRRHVDTRIGIDHIARDTRCDLVWRGLAGQRARAVFHGGILIRAGADGTAAALSNKNLLLSAEAEIDTQPMLEIHADEVQAAHGATVGQLDPTALFYLRSRGLPETEARALLTGAFCREISAGLADAGTRGLVEAALAPALARLGA